jgi:hypothetical protein
MLSCKTAVTAVRGVLLFSLSATATVQAWPERAEGKSVEIFLVLMTHVQYFFCVNCYCGRFESCHLSDSWQCH